MIGFIKLTPEQCERMWHRVRFDIIVKHGKVFLYQVCKRNFEIFRKSSVTNYQWKQRLIS